MIRYLWNASWVEFHNILEIREVISVYINSPHTEADTGRVLLKKVLLKISENSQENTCVGVSFLIKLQVSGLQLYRKRDSHTGILQWIL